MRERETKKRKRERRKLSSASEPQRSDNSLKVHKVGWSCGGWQHFMGVETEAAAVVVVVAAATVAERRGGGRERRSCFPFTVITARVRRRHVKTSQRRN